MKSVNVIKRYVILFCISILGVCTATFAKENMQEKTHFTVAIDPEYIPFTQKDIDNMPSGLLIDFWDMWAKKNGYTVSYKFYPWEETLKATERGEVDFHSGTTLDREWMHASAPIYELKTALFTLRDSSLNTVFDFAGKRIGTIDTYYGQMVKNAVGGSAEIIRYENYEPLVEALKNGEIDAIVEDVDALRYFFIKTGQMNRFKMVNNKQLQFTNTIYAITNSQNAVLLKQINRGLKNLDLTDLVKLEKVWLPRADDAFYYKKLLQQVKYTAEEKRWIGKQGKLTVTGDPAWIHPNDIYTSKEYRGVAGDYIESIADKIGIEFKMLPVESWAEVLATPPEESADIIMGTMNSALRKRFEERYTFLEPYEAGPLVIIMDKNIRFVTDLYDIKNKRIGILSLQNYTEPLEFKYTTQKFYKYLKVKTLLDNLINGEVDAVILPLPDAILALANEQYSKLDIVGKMDEKAYVNTAIINTKPMLQNIIKKALQTTTVHYKQNILAKWMHKLNYVQKIDYGPVYKIIGIFTLLILSLGYYTYILNRKNHYEQELNAKVQEVARTDDLTGLHNKRAFNHMFEQTHEDKKSLGLLFIDVDHFKAYNDYYGHMEGDRALKKIARILQSFQSEQSHPYRIGGEEFGMVLYDMTIQEAEELSKQICKKIESQKIEHASSPYGYITVSIGISVAAPSRDRHFLYLQADKALYTAKALGRNTIYIYTEDTSREGSSLSS